MASIEERLAALKALIPEKKSEAVAPTPPPPAPKVAPPPVTVAEVAALLDDSPDEDDNEEQDPIDQMPILATFKDDAPEPTPPPNKAPYEHKTYLVKGFGKRYECGHYATCLDLFKGSGNAHCPSNCEQFVKPVAERATEFMQGTGYYWQ